MKEGRRRRLRRRRAERILRERLEQNGKPCTYCARIMSMEVAPLYPTRDHVEPRSQGGKITVWACLTCNAVKRDMTEEQWMVYRAENDFWWLGARARKAARWTPRPMQDNFPSIPSETGPEAEGISDDALTAEAGIKRPGVGQAAGGAQQEPGQP